MNPRPRLLRTFLLRRAALVCRGQGDVVLVGSENSLGTLQLQQFLSRNDHPYAYLDIDIDVDAGARIALEACQVSAHDVPVLICRGGHVLRNPSIEAVGERLGFSAIIDANVVHDLIVVGAFPGGLAAAVYAASEGLDVVVIESRAPGGLAGSSSKIENYLGFPTGVSGVDFAARALAQAEKVGASMLIARSVVRLHCETRPYRLELADGAMLSTRATVVASGDVPHAGYRGSRALRGGRRLLRRYFRRGEAQVIIVGGGNSAGQAAIFLSHASF